MELYLLKVKHIYDEEFEDCGIFSSRTGMEAGKRDYLRAKEEESFGPDEFRFSYTTMELDRVYR